MDANLGNQDFHQNVSKYDQEKPQSHTAEQLKVIDSSQKIT